MKDIYDKNYCSKIDTCHYVNHGVAGDTCGLTELHFSAFRNDVEGVKLLLTKDINVNCKNSCGQTPLLIAVQNRSIEVAEILLACGANVNIPNLRGYSPIQAAIDINDEEMLNLLIAYCMGA